MIVIAKTLEFDMGHRVPNHKSKCRNLHGHRYKVTFFISGPISTQAGASDESMVMDFSDITSILKKHIDDHYDHKTILYCKDELLKVLPEAYGVLSVDYIPTAEEIAEKLHSEAEVLLINFKGITCVKVELYETPTSLAISE